MGVYVYAEGDSQGCFLCGKIARAVSIDYEPPLTACPECFDMGMRDVPLQVSRFWGDWVRIVEAARPDHKGEDFAHCGCCTLDAMRDAYRSLSGEVDPELARRLRLLLIVATERKTDEIRWA